jgi:branched-chain amino acid transport system ATP-binding protein
MLAMTGTLRLGERRVVEALFDIVRQLAATGVTIVVVEQFASVVLDRADRVAVMAQGRVKVTGTPDETRDVLASAYLGGAS